MPWGLIYLAVAFVAFGTMARISPCNRGQPRFVSRDLADNALFWFLGLLCFADVDGALVRGGVSLAFQRRAPEVIAAISAGYGLAARLPLSVQALAILVAMDFIQYWLHRLFHGRTLWPFHAIHHSVEDLDWTATYRIHPVNFLVYSAGALAVVRLAGFSPAAFLVIGPFNLVAGALAHANLDWTFGPFRYVIASPVYHRWHHVKDSAVHDRNFAPTFPVWDLMFGTFYMPRGVLPSDYGVEGVPHHFLAQLVYPFRVLAERFGLGKKAGVGAASAA